MDIMMRSVKQKIGVSPEYLSIDQGPEVVMIENYRSGLLWKLFMSCPEVQNGLKKIKISKSVVKIILDN